MQQPAHVRPDRTQQLARLCRRIEPPARLQPYTVPEPFALQGHKGVDERMERTRREVEAARMAECTFAPRVNEPSVATLLRESRANY